MKLATGEDDVALLDHEDDEVEINFTHNSAIPIFPSRYLKELSSDEQTSDGLTTLSGSAAQLTSADLRKDLPASFASLKTPPLSGLCRRINRMFAVNPFCRNLRFVHESGPVFSSMAIG